MAANPDQVLGMVGETLVKGLVARLESHLFTDYHISLSRKRDNLEKIRNINACMTTVWLSCRVRLL